MEIFAKCYPSTLNHLLMNNRVMNVHSIYQSTINFSHNKKIYSLHHRDIPLNPMSIILNLDQKSFGELFRDVNLVEVRDQSLIINNLPIKIVQANEVNCNLNQTIKESKASLDNIQKFYQNLFNFLTNLSRQSEYFGAIYEKTPQNYYTARLKPIIKSKDINVISKALISIIGLGKGLTPAGDDIVCGIISSLQINLDAIDIYKINLIISNIKLAINHQELTSDISKQFIDYALDGQHSELVNRLYQAIANNQEIEKILEQISNIGFSSGIDFLTGMYIGHLIGGNLK